MQICRLCKKEKPFTDFYKAKGYITGYDKRCKVCFSALCVLRHRNSPPLTGLNWRKKKKLEDPTYFANKQKKKLLNPLEKFKEKVRAKTRYEIKLGKIKKLPCEKCGEKKVDVHHEDYNKPWKLKWLCRKHHREIHRKKDLSIIKSLSSNKPSNE